MTISNNSSGDARQQQRGPWGFEKRRDFYQGVRRVLGLPSRRESLYLTIEEGEIMTKEFFDPISPWKLDKVKVGKLMEELGTYKSTFDKEAVSRKLRTEKDDFVTQSAIAAAETLMARTTGVGSASASAQQQAPTKPDTAAKPPGVGSASVRASAQQQAPTKPDAAAKPPGVGRDNAHVVQDDLHKASGDEDEEDKVIALLAVAATLLEHKRKRDIEQREKGLKNKRDDLERQRDEYRKKVKVLQEEKKRMDASADEITEDEKTIANMKDGIKKMIPKFMDFGLTLGLGVQPSDDVVVEDGEIHIGQS